MVGVNAAPQPQHPPEHLVQMLLNGKHRRDADSRLQSGRLCPFPAVGFSCPALPFLPWRRIDLGLPTASYCLVGFPEKWCFWGRRLPRTKSAASSVCDTEMLQQKEPCQHLQWSFGEKITLAGWSQCSAEAETASPRISALSKTSSDPGRAELGAQRDKLWCF